VQAITLAWKFQKHLFLAVSYCHWAEGHQPNDATAACADSCLEEWNGGVNSTSSIRNSTAAEVDELWKTYTVFTVVRNPLARAASSYKFLLSAMAAEPNKCRTLVSSCCC
jgi:hypothetical protein